MSDIVQYGGGGGIDRFARRSSRAIDRGRSVTQVRQARIADAADIGAEKLDQLTYLTGNGLLAVSKVGAMQKQLEQQAPELSGRLSALADNHTLMAVEVIEDTRRSMRRL